MDKYKVYTINGKEFFQFIAGDGNERGQTISFALGESLMRFLEIDVSGHPYLTIAGKHDPAYIIGLQNQMRELVAGVFSNPRGKETAMDRLTEFYGGEAEGRFTLGPLTTYYEIAGDGGLCEILEPKTIEDILNFLIRAMLRADVFCKTCRHCGKYFIPSHGNVGYCERLIDGTEKTCREVGAVRLYREKQRQNPILAAYERAYKTHFARIKYKKMTAEEFRKWGERARTCRDEVLAGTRAPEELMELLSR